MSAARRRSGGMDPVRAGVLTLVLVAIGTYLGFTKDLPFVGGGERVSAVFASAASEIRPNSPVRIAGVNVGKVADVRRGPGGTAVVEMELSDDALPLHRDATAKIRPRLFLEGNFFVELEPGSPSAPLLGEGGRIPLPQTAIPVQLDEVLGVFTADTRQSTRDLLDGYADALDEGGAAALNRSYEDWEGAFAGTATTMRALRGTRDGDLAGFVRDQARVNDVLAERRAELGTFVTAFARTMSAFADRQADLGATVRESAGLLRDAPAALAGVDRLLPPLERFAQALRPALDVAPGVLDRTRPLLAALSSVSAPAALPGLARDLTPAAGALTRLGRGLPPLFDDVERVSDCVRDKLVPVLNATVPDGHLTTDQPVWQEGLRFPIGLAGAQQHFDGNAFSTRYELGLDRDPVVTRLGTADELVQVAPERILGSRPRFRPGYQPPIRPDADCREQDVAKLEADTVPAPAGQRTVRLQPVPAWTRARLRKELDRRVAGLRRQAAREADARRRGAGR